MTTTALILCGAGRRGPFYARDARGIGDEGVVFEQGQRVRVHATGVPEFATVRHALPAASSKGWTLILLDDAGRLYEVALEEGLGRQVRKGERGIAILASCVQRVLPVDNHDAAGKPEMVRILPGFRVAHVWDISQTDGDALPEIRPALLAGEAPEGLPIASQCRQRTVRVPVQSGTARRFAVEFSPM